MYKKAQNMIEISLVVLFAAIVAIFLVAGYNNQKNKVAALSKPTINSAAINLKTGVYNPGDIVPYSPAETAGSNALKLLDPNMTLDKYNALMSNIKYGDLKTALDVPNTEMDLTGLGNKLISDLKLPLANLSAENVGLNTLSSLTAILNAIADNNLGQDATAQAYMQSLKALLDQVALPTS